jgi:hypothetical protein
MGTINSLASYDTPEAPKGIALHQGDVLPSYVCRPVQLGHSLQLHAWSSRENYPCNALQIKRHHVSRYTSEARKFATLMYVYVRAISLWSSHEHGLAGLVEKVLR